MRVVVLLVVAACGRVAFDATPRDGAGGEAGPDDGASDALDDADLADAMIDVLLAGHDEDGDAIDDAVDPCPHIAGDLADADGDGVGNACDPRPGSNDRITMFDPMTALPAGLELTTGTWQIVGDELAHPNTAFGTISRQFAIGNADIWAGIDVVAIAGTAQQVILHASAGTEDPRYYGQAYTTSGINVVSLVRYDGAYTALDEVPLGGSGVHTGALTLHMHVALGGTATWSVAWPGETFGATATLPAYAGASRFRLMFDGVQVRVRYLLVVGPSGSS